MSMSIEALPANCAAPSAPTPQARWQRLVGRMCAALAWRKTRLLLFWVHSTLSHSEAVTGRLAWLSEEVVEEDSGAGAWTCERVTRNTVAALTQLRDPKGGWVPSVFPGVCCLEVPREGMSHSGLGGAPRAHGSPSANNHHPRASLSRYPLLLSLHPAVRSGRTPRPRGPASPFDMLWWARGEAGGPKAWLDHVVGIMWEVAGMSAQAAVDDESGMAPPNLLVEVIQAVSRGGCLLACGHGVHVTSHVTSVRAGRLALPCQLSPRPRQSTHPCPYLGLCMPT